MIKCKSVDFHSSLFVGGRNFGLRAEAKPGLELTYDRTEKELCVKWAGAIKYLPSTSVLAYEPMESNPAKAVPFKAAPQKTPIKAQVSTPTGIVERE